MLASSGRVLMPLLAVLMGRVSVLLSLFVLAEIVMMRRLVMVMRGGVVACGGLVMVLAGRMF